MNAHSGLRIAARWRDGRIAGVVIDNARPRAARALLGLPAAEACARVPTLFSVCRMAQGIAARLACAAAYGEEGAVPVTPISVAAQPAEMIQEPLWRLLLDWPAAISSTSAAPTTDPARSSASHARASHPPAVRPRLLAWYHGERGQQRITTAEFAILTLLLLLGGGAFWYYQHASGRSRHLSQANFCSAIRFPTSPA